MWHWSEEVFELLNSNFFGFWIFIDRLSTILFGRQGVQLHFNESQSYHFDLRYGRINVLVDANILAEIVIVWWIGRLDGGLWDIL